MSLPSKMSLWFLPPWMLRTLCTDPAPALVRLGLPTNSVGSYSAPPAVLGLNPAGKGEEKGEAWVSTAGAAREGEGDKISGMGTRGLFEWGGGR